MARLKNTNISVHLFIRVLRKSRFVNLIYESTLSVFELKIEGRYTNKRKNNDTTGE